MKLAPYDIKALESGTLFSGIPIDLMLPKLANCEVRQIAAGEVLLAPGDANDRVYLVLEGELQVQIDRICAPVHATLSQGDCAGEVSLIDGLPVSAWVKAAVPTRLLEVPNELLWSLVDQSTTMARNLLTILTGRMRRSNLTIVTAQEGKFTAEEKIGLDPLTGLFNRRLFLTRVPRQLKRAGRGEVPASLMLLRLMPFDASHMSSTDKVLAFKAEVVAVAGRMVNGLRPEDVAGRTGETEFAVLLANAGIDEAREIAGRVMAQIAGSPVVIADQTVTPELQCSVVEFKAPESVDKLLKRGLAAFDTDPIRNDVEAA